MLDAYFPMPPLLTLLPRGAAHHGVNLIASALQENAIGWYGGMTCNGVLQQHLLGTIAPRSYVHPQSLSLELLSHDFDFSRWEERCHRVLSSISNGDLSKCVLSRASVLRASSAVSPWAFLQNLRYPKCSLLMWHTESTTWIASTPEVLFERHGERLSTEALAGTMAIDPARSLVEQQQDLLHSSRQRLECELVRDRILDVLMDCGVRQFTVSPLEVLTYPHLMHLCMQITATWPQPDDAALLTALHPTPAVCGTPPDRSKVLRNSLETRDRGWYAGALGYSTPSHAWFAVVLRCAELLDDHHLRAWTGVGLTTKSTPQAEWDELDTKLRWYLGGPPSLRSDNHLHAEAHELSH